MYFEKENKTQERNFNNKISFGILKLIFIGLMYLLIKVSFIIEMYEQPKHITNVQDPCTIL